MICPRCGTIAAGQSPCCSRCGGEWSRGPAPGADLAEPPIPRAPTRRGELAQKAAGIVPQILARPKPRPEVAPQPPPPSPPAPGGPPSGWTAPGPWAPPAPWTPPLPPTSPAPPPLWAPPGAPVAPNAPPDPQGPPASSAPSPAAPVGPSAPTPAAEPTAAGTAPEGAGSWPPPPAAWEPAPGSAGPSAGPAAAPRWAAPPAGWTRAPAPDWVRSAGSWARGVTRRSRQASPTQTATPPTYMWQSLVCLLTLLPSAVVALVYSVQVNRRVQLGDSTGAIRASRLARTWCLVTAAAFSALVLWLLAAGVP
jgi:hypothetical protein